MIAKPMPYEVGYQITEHRSIVVFATSEADALAKAQAIDFRDPEMFDWTTSLPECWTAHRVEP